MDKIDQTEGWFLTKGLKEKFEKDEEFAMQVLEAMAKFLKNDWGDTSQEDCAFNDKSSQTGGSIVAKYKTKLGNILIIEEQGHKVTTILFANEY